jgi:MYXO-CTERM domain-containing protein
LVLAATYGLLVTTDRGASWRYVCEAAYGVTDLPIDALTAFTPEGALLAGIYSGVSRAEREPCDFVRTLGRNNREAVPDFALAASTPGRVLAIQVAIPEEGEPYSQLYRSDDDGRTWQSLAEPLPAALQTPLTIDVAPSDSKRVYVSGLGPDDEGVLLRSDDGGESFEVLAIPTDPLQFEHPYIAAVDAEAPERIFLRTDVWTYDAVSGSATASDALLVSEDGGEHFSELSRAGGKLFGFAFSPDGGELLIGYGDPLEAGSNRLTDPDALGIYRGPKTGGPLVKTFAGSVGCLSWTEQGIYLCTHEIDTGYSLGLIDDVTFDLRAPPEVEPLLVLADVRGPIVCPECSSGAVCQAYWLPTCQSWGRTDCVGLDPPRCETDGGAAGQTGVSVTPDAGEASASGGAPSFDGLEQPGPLPRGGCACRATPEAAANTYSLLSALLLALLRRRSRR